MKYALVPADKAAKTSLLFQVALHLHFKTGADEQTSAKQKSVINNHIFRNAIKFGVSVDEDQEIRPTFYWLPKLHKQLYKARFNAKSSSCTTTDLSNC